VSPTLDLDSALKERVRAVLDRRGVTEAELRKLFDEGGACVRILNAEVEDAEQRLAELTADPDSSLADIAGVYRRLNEVRPDLDELRSLLRQLEARARQVRADWVRV
jgi:chromosome segregation ATPase